MFREHGVDTAVVEAGTFEVTPNYYNGVVVCAPVHAGGYQRSVVQWVRQHAETLRFRPTAFVSVCLGVLQQDAKVQGDLKAIVEKFERDTGWRPTTVKMIAGALLYRQYGWMKRFVMKRIVTKAGGDTDTSRDYEYTDWDDLRTFAANFRGLLEPVSNNDLKVAVGI
jgi:menaquinone-dependent protoporphyrinogen oxidase